MQNKIQKAAILFTNPDSMLKAEQMLLEAGYNWFGSFRLSEKISDCVAILVGWDFNKTNLVYIHRATHCSLMNNHDWTIFIDSCLTPEDVQTFENAAPIKKPTLIDFKWLDENKACTEGFKWFVARFGMDQVCSDIVIEKLRECGRSDWIVWLEKRI